MISQLVLRFLICFFFYAASAGIAYAQERCWQRSAQSVGKVKAILAIDKVPGVVFIGTDKGVWKSIDSGLNWRMILKLPGAVASINASCYGPRDNILVYAATDSGLYVTKDMGVKWARLFRVKNASEGSVIASSIAGDFICLGTKNGLFLSRDKGRNWEKVPGRLGNSNIVSVCRTTASEKEFFIALDEDVYRSIDAGGHWERVLHLPSMRDPQDEPEEQEDQEEPGYSLGTRYLLAHPAIPGFLYLATGRGIYVSQDHGTSWDALTKVGLPCRDIICLSVSPSGSLCVLTRAGVFALEADRWVALSGFMTARDLNYICFDKSGSIYCAADNGLFISTPGRYVQAVDPGIIGFYCKGEPSIKEVQSAAVKYAEVEPEKIRRWRTLAAKKAWLPTLGIGVDTNSTDLWHWETGSSTKAEDDCLRKGRASLEWGVTLSWDLADLVWNAEQTSIDVRSRLTVQLRQDILDEVTKIYFERIRRKIELNTLPIEDRKKRQESELGIQELTASLDALTGGYFSGHLKT